MQKKPTAIMGNTTRRTCSQFGELLLGKVLGFGLLVMIKCNPCINNEVFDPYRGRFSLRRIFL